MYMRAAVITIIDSHSVYIQLKCREITRGITSAILSNVVWSEKMIEKKQKRSMG